jgi:CheY-like chemotaxis protein
MSHEMRTLLNAVVGLTQITLDEEFEDVNPELIANMKKVNRSGMMLLGLVNDILDLSKLGAGKFDLIPVEYDVASLINDTIALNVARVGSKPIRFILDIEEDMPSRLFGDDLRIKQILNNLLSNAFKYTEKGTITFKMRTQRKGACVTLAVDVIDTGIGIKPEHVDKLFSAYNQVDTSANRKIEGTGLGLSITLTLAQMMGGTVSVSSVYGEGSTFRVVVEQSHVTDVPIGKTVVESLRTFDYAYNKWEQATKFQHISMPYAKILLVDDVVTNLEVVKGLMKRYNMHIDTATSGQAAIDIVKDAKIEYDVIFMDHMMPGMDGIEATRLIRNQIDSDYARTVPIIAFTANAIQGNRETLLSNGFQDFISKPIDLRELDTLLKKWVRNKEKEAAQVSCASQLRNEAGLAIKTTALPSVTSGSEGIAASGQTRIAELEGIDTTALLERFNNDEKLTLQILESYGTSTPGLLASITDPAQEDLPDYAIVVHGIKSSSYSIYARDVGRRAEALEHAAKAGDLAFIKQHNDVFIDRAQQVLAGLNAFLAEARKWDESAIKATMDPELLRRLAQACSAYNMDEADALVAELEQWHYKAGQDLADSLKSLIQKSDFDAMAELITKSGLL